MQSHHQLADWQCQRQFQLSCWPHSCIDLRRPPAPLGCAESRGVHLAPYKEQSQPQAHLGIHKKGPQVSGRFLSVFISVQTVSGLSIPLNQWTRGEGTPVAWHSRMASPPVDTSMAGWVTVIVGASEEKHFLKSFKIVFKRKKCASTAMMSVRQHRGSILIFLLW